ncbi:F-box/LRR-repeat protein 3-like [Aphidius gifuensis]|uniref:F-box/LRR-repeat protein 3-like n=1 Tax=Aphidius gifuensis TaxID=684658 RepID=UPI001CDD39D8|nr:F-box/LRR-repeat protein 3-like [Aphidius gifuensis]
MLHPDWNTPVDISIKNWDNLLNLEHLGIRWRINDNMAIKLVKYCKKLRSLDIRIKGITETAFQKLTELKKLDNLNYCFVNGVSRNEFIDTIFTISNNWKKLKHLSISCNNIDDIDDDSNGLAPSTVVCDELSKLQYLEDLNVLNMHYFHDSSIIAISNSCKNLRKLDVSSCIYITEAALMSITSLHKLEELNVSNIDGVTDNFIITEDEFIITILTITNNWKKLKHLIILNEFTDGQLDEHIIGPVPPTAVYDELSKLKYLEYLNVLNMRNFHDSSLIAIANSCKNLQKLEISLCVYITEAALMSITSLEKLKEIRVSNIDGVTDNFINFIIMSQESICHVREQDYHVDEKRDLISTLNHDSLAQIFMWLTVTERIAMEKGNKNYN